MRTIQIEQHGYKEYYVYVRNPDGIIHDVWGFFESVAEADLVVKNKYTSDMRLLAPQIVEEFDLLKKTNPTRGRTGNER